MGGTPWIHNLGGFLTFVAFPNPHPGACLTPVEADLLPRSSGDHILVDNPRRLRALVADR